MRVLPISRDARARIRRGLRRIGNRCCGERNGNQAAGGLPGGGRLARRRRSACRLVAAGLLIRDVSNMFGAGHGVKLDPTFNYSGQRNQACGLVLPRQRPFKSGRSTLGGQPLRQVPHLLAIIGNLGECTRLHLLGRPKPVLRIPLLEPTRGELLRGSGQRRLNRRSPNHAGG